MKHWVYAISLFSIVFLLSACGTGKSGAEEEVEETEQTEQESEAVSSTEAVHVELINTAGEKVGIAQLTPVVDGGGVNINLEAWDLSPGIHGFHIHEKGVCEEPDFETAGGHFNPENREHGFDNPEGPHAGDLPNIEVDEDGKVEDDIVTELVTLQKGQENSIIREGGTSLMIHADPDDYVSQPAGDAGDRVACGVIDG